MSISQNKSKKNLFFMRLALAQAEKGLGNTGQNPSVGCVITDNKSVISSGHTGFKGRPHGESIAIKSANKKSKNLEIYITLEPCSHYGKTPPCVKTIIRNKIKKVFFSLKDPDPRSYNKSPKQFKKNKIKVQNGILSSEVKSFYTSYFKYKKDVLPFVTAKIAMSKDFFTINTN